MEKLIEYLDLYMEFPAIVIKIISLSITEELNEHGIAKVFLLTDDEDKCQILHNLTSETNIKIVVAKINKKTVLFLGIPTKITIKNIKKVTSVELELKSKSFLLDWEKRSQSFQNQKSTYKEVFQKLIEKDNGGLCCDNASKGAVIEKPLVQYMESDWEFIKRISSKLNTKIITDIKNDRPAITIGIQQGDTYTMDSYNYEVFIDNGECLKIQTILDNWKPIHSVQYIVKSTYHFNLYDVLIYDKISFIIVKKRMELENGIIIFTYWISYEHRARQVLMQNDKLSGVSINGIILDVQGEKVKLHLCIDQCQPLEDAFWYKIQSPYIGSGNAGFYSMPEIGDTVQLYFPKGSSEEGIVRNCFPITKNVSTLYSPDIKSFGNTQGKEILFSSTQIQATAINGLILINMDENCGIEIASSNNITINSNNNAKIFGKNITLRAGDEICLATKYGSIIIDKNINVKAEKGVSI